MEAEGEIYAVSMEEDGPGDAVRVTDTPALESRPRISPDGTMVLFQREENGGVTIVMGTVENEEGEPPVWTYGRCPQVRMYPLNQSGLPTGTSLS